MMKFNVLELNVIKTKTNNKYYYFICKKKPFSNIYLEVLTNQKLVPQTKECIEPLTNYYSLFEKINFKTNRPLMLTKKETLIKCIEINQLKTENKENEDNEFGDKNYQMKNHYDPNNLVIAKLQRISSIKTDFGPIVETTKQQYIFERIPGEEHQYREIFTGFIVQDTSTYFDLPYCCEKIPFLERFPNAKKEIPKLSLIWAQNDINYPEKKNNNNNNNNKVKNRNKKRRRNDRNHLATS